MKNRNIVEEPRRHIHICTRIKGRFFVASPTKSGNHCYARGLSRYERTVHKDGRGLFLHFVFLAHWLYLPTFYCMPQSKRICFIYSSYFVHAVQIEQINIQPKVWTLDDPKIQNTWIFFLLNTSVNIFHCLSVLNWQ